MIPLGTFATDTATGLRGMLVNAQIEMDLALSYLLQPTGLDEDGQPFERIWLVRNRLAECAAIDQPFPIDLPVEVLGTVVEDKATGYKGMAVAVIIHISGCVHVNIQAKGRRKNGQAIKLLNADFRRLVGPAVPVLSESDRLAAQQKTPSPYGEELPPRH